MGCRCTGSASLAKEGKKSGVCSGVRSAWPGDATSRMTVILVGSGAAQALRGVQTREKTEGPTETISDRAVGSSLWQLTAATTFM